MMCCESTRGFIAARLASTETLQMHGVSIDAALVFRYQVKSIIKGYEAYHEHTGTVASEALAYLNPLNRP